MKYILTEEHIDIPEGVTVTAKRKEVEIKGPLGTLRKAFKHVPISIKMQ
jgi:large subunit ribosomal protein L9e